MQLAAVTDSILDASRVASAFARAGHETTVLLHEHSQNTVSSSALVLDADLRGLSKLDSRTRLQRLGRNLRHSQIAFFRFDSSLRRPWDDLFATLEASGRNKVILAAFSPLEGFEVRHGTVFWHGSPLHRSSLARDRLNPVYDANIPELLEREGLGAVALVRDITPHSIQAALEKARFVIVDGGNRGDAERLVASVPEPEAVLWAGSANLARAIGSAFAVSEPLDFATTDLAAPTLLALGGNSQTLEQLKVLRAAGLSTVPLEPNEQGIVRAVDQARLILQKSGCALYLETPPSAFGVPAAQVQRSSLEAISEVIAQLSHNKCFENLLLCGTPLATSSLRRLNAQGIHIDPFTDSTHLIAPNPHRIQVRASSDAPQTLLGAYQCLAG
jgi:D-threonate/D-erythronate kinase